MVDRTRGKVARKVSLAWGASQIEVLDGFINRLSIFSITQAWTLVLGVSILDKATEGLGWLGLGWVRGWVRLGYVRLCRHPHRHLGGLQKRVEIRAWGLGSGLWGYRRGWKSVPCAVGRHTIGGKGEGCP